MDNIVVIESSSDSDYSDSSSDHDQREEIQYENTHFMNHIKNTSNSALLHLNTVNSTIKSVIKTTK